jgi:hypothetical protein
MRKVTTPVPVEGGVLDVQRNGSPISTITFGIGASAGTFATADGGAETFAAGDRLAIINDNPADPSASWMRLAPR